MRCDKSEGQAKRPPAESRLKDVAAASILVSMLRGQPEASPRVGTLHAGVRAPHPEPKLRSREGITCAFRPNRLLTGCPLGRARHAHFDRAGPRGHPVKERSRSFETFDQPILARCLN